MQAAAVIGSPCELALHSGSHSLALFRHEGTLSGLSIDEDPHVTYRRGIEVG